MMSRIGACAAALRLVAPRRRERRIGIDGEMMMMMTDRSELDPTVFRDRLLAERDELTASSEGARDARRPVVLDQPSVGRLSRMDALQMQAMAIETERRRQMRLERIAAALKRIEQGSFGECVSCGERIAWKRLEFDPTSPRCLGCAQNQP